MNNLKEISIENCTCYYFEALTRIEVFDFDNVLLHKKSYENILAYGISHKSLIGARPLRIRFNKVDGFIRVYDGTTYLALFGPEKHDAIYNRIKYFISQKSVITYVFSHNYARIKIDSYNSLPLEKRLILHNDIILIKSFFDKN